MILKVWLNEKKRTEFSPSDLGFIIGLNLPLILIHFILKWQRASIFGDIDNLIHIFNLYREDILFYCVYILLGLGVLNICKTLKFKIISFILLQLFGITFSILEVSAHTYYMTTGTMFNYSLFQYSILNLGELSSVVSSIGGSSSFIILVICLIFSSLGPWITGFLILKYREKKFTSDYFNLTLQKKWSVVSLSILGMILFLIPTLVKSKNDFSQNLTLNLISSFVGDIFTVEPARARSWVPPVDGHLKQYNISKKRNLVIIVLESTRADATSVYNPELDTTPFLKKISEKSIIARNAHSLIPHTSKCLVAIHCGIEPGIKTAIIEAEKHGIPAKCLPELLNEIGYKTVYFQTATEHFENRRGIVGNLGFSKFFPGNLLPKLNYQPTNYFGYEDRILLAPSKEWHLKRLRDEPNRPFMVTYLTNISHHDYSLPSTHKKKWFHPNAFYNQYLNTVNYMDSFVKDILHQYIELGIYRNTVFVFIGDHGESFREHGYYGHSNTVYWEGNQIPFMIHDPLKFHQSIEIDYPVYQPDLLPTLLGLLDLQLDKNTYRGYDILKGRSNRKLYGACWNENICASTYDNNYKYIYFFGKKQDEFYDLRNDPLEKKNIISTTNENIESWRNSSLEWYHMNKNFYDSFREKKNAETSDSKKSGFIP